MTDSLAARSLLITGVAGLVGRETADRAARAGFAPIWGTWHNQEPEPLAGVQFVRMDITDRAATDALVRDLRPRAIIHTAYRKTGPNAQAVNADGAGNVAAAAARADARMVHISSDMVLDGDHAPYDERAVPSPVLAYGRSKADAERLVRHEAPDSAIVRTSLVCRLNPPDPVSGWILDALQSRKPITLFTDEIRCAIWLPDLADALLELAGGSFSGIINVAGPQALSRHAMGLLLARHWDMDPAPLLASLSTASPTRRPRDLTLDTSLARLLLQTRLRGFQQRLGDGQTMRQAERAL